VIAVPTGSTALQLAENCPDHRGSQLQRNHSTSCNILVVLFSITLSVCAMSCNSKWQYITNSPPSHPRPTCLLRCSRKSFLPICKLHVLLQQGFPTSVERSSDTASVWPWWCLSLLQSPPPNVPGGCTAQCTTASRANATSAKNDLRAYVRLP
jgi:hypothetical protein